MTVLLIGLLSCQNQKPAENGSFTTASYNLRYANAEDSAAGNGWGKRYPVMAKLIQYHGFDIFGTQEGYIQDKVLPGLILPSRSLASTKIMQMSGKRACS